MRRALPTIALTAAGLTWLLRAQGVIGTGPVPAGSVTAGAPTRPPAEGAVPGQPVTTQYGPVQVAAVVRAGRLAEVEALQAPADNPNSKRINDQALPVLRQEALAAQSAQIDTVAGATFTSEGYRRSLQSAIDAAHTGPAPSAAPTTGPPTPTTAPAGPSTRPGATTAGTAAPSPTSPATTTAKPTTTTPSGPPVTTTVTADGIPVTITTGPVQVRATVSGGRITEVQALTYPQGNPISAALNAVAIPKLRDQAVRGQSAQGLTAVTGATLTSEAFRTSLQAALDAAGFHG
jgi:uncharacterized protein with FMN-binding domain